MPEVNIPPKPELPCPCCKGTEWWLMQDIWICQQCHPNPNEEVK
jgi:ribosomal protein L37AE/L43A